MQLRTDDVGKVWLDNWEIYKQLGAILVIL